MSSVQIRVFQFFGKAYIINSKLHNGRDIRTKQMSAASYRKYYTWNSKLIISEKCHILLGFAHDLVCTVVCCTYRAEECFKQAIETELPDAEALSKYANFLWVIRKDLWGAEQRYLQAMAVEPDNTYHASIYADFLWSTGGEETCFPLTYSQ